MFEARLYKKLKGGMVECEACNWRCKILKGKTGVCRFRKNVGGKLFLLMDERPMTVQLDPIEKKPLFHFLPGTMVLSVGTVGCSFACEFCQNWEISQVKEEINGKNYEFKTEPEELVRYAVENRIPSIAFTYNEPTIFSEFAVAVMRLAKKHGIYGVYVSNGYMTEETLDYLEGYIDGYNIDLKAFTEGYYRKICHARLAPVLRSIEEIYRRGKWLEITTMLLPGKNDSEREIRDMANFICGVSPNIPWHLIAARPEYKMKKIKVMSREKLVKAEEIGRETGLKYVYGGFTLKPSYQLNMEGVWK